MGRANAWPQQHASSSGKPPGTFSAAFVSDDERAPKQRQMDLYVAKNRRRTARLRLAANSNASRGAMDQRFLSASLVLTIGERRDAGQFHGSEYSGRPATRWGIIALASPAVLAIGAAAAAIALWIRGGAGGSVPAGASPHTVATQLTNYGGTEASGALSPDGRSFAFESDHGGTPDIWLRQVSGGEPVQLTHDAAEEADLAYAPDGESIYFTRTDPAGSGIWQIGALGGQSRKMLDGAQKPAPARDGRRLAAVTQGTNRSWTISVTDFNGGAMRDLVHGIENGYGSPRTAWSPDGRWLAYSAGALFGPAGVFVVDVGTGLQRRVIELPLGTNDSGQPASRGPLLAGVASAGAHRSWHRRRAGRISVASDDDGGRRLPGAKRVGRRFPPHGDERALHQRSVESTAWSGP